MSYQTIVNTIRNAAIAVNPDGTFRHGRRVDASQGSIDDAFPVIHLYPFQTTDTDSGSDGFDKSGILMGFWKQDSADTSVSEREQIISEMDELVSEWKAAMEESKTIRITSFKREPQYQMFQGTVSGYAVQFTFDTISEC